MEQFLCITATLLAQRYHAGEWPPSPARLFQALLAGARTGCYRSDWAETEPVLRFLEQLESPEILASPQRPGKAYRIAVPNNDSDKPAREWIAGRAFDTGKIRTMKDVAPRDLLKPAEEGPHLCYIWRLQGNRVSSAALGMLVSSLHTLGWGLDMAYGQSFVVDEQGKRGLIADFGGPHYIPATKGAPYKVPAPGYLDDLQESYRRFCDRVTRLGVDPSIRATSYREERYQIAGHLSPSIACFSLRQLSDSERWYSVPWARGMEVAAWMRHAVGVALRQEGYSEKFVNSYALGHGEEQTETGHIAFVPLPTVRPKHGDGAVRRVMLVEPANADGTIASLLLRKLAPSDLYKRDATGAAVPVCALSPVMEGDPVLPSYCSQNRPVLVWHSVTPVILHGHNSERGRISLKKTENLLRQAFEKAGHPDNSIASLFFQAAPFWAGAGGARTMRVPKHLAKWPRYHVAVRFKEPIRGPLLVGIGKYYGVGLFAASHEH